MEQHFGSSQLIAKYNCPCQPYTIVELENLRRTENREQTDREFNYRGHFYPLWIVGLSGPISCDILYY